MTSTPPEDSPLSPARPQAAAAARNSAAVFGRPISAAGRDSRRRRRRSARRARPATVWQCGGDDRRDDTARLSGWLSTAIVKIVTGYSRPGDRVLLLTPPPTTTDPVHRTGASLYDGLHEAAWTVLRLGRGIQTWSAHRPDITYGSHPGAIRVSDLADPASPRSGAGPRPRTDGRHRSDRTGTDAGMPVRSRPPTAGPDRFDVIITTVSPQHPDWTRDVDWARLPTPHGVTAVVTHSDNSLGKLIDPTGQLVNTMRDRGLEWIDHVILLDTTPDPDREPGQPAPAPHCRVHHDLLLFTSPPSAVGRPGERPAGSSEGKHCG